MTATSTFSTSRTLPAPPAAVYAAIADPARLARWWGPAGFSNRFSVFEFRAGGRWVFEMVGPDGTVYANESVFVTTETNRQVVIRHVCQPHFSLTITLEPISTGPVGGDSDTTLLHWAQAFDDAAVANAVRHIVEPANEQNLDRLTAEVVGHPPTSA